MTTARAPNTTKTLVAQAKVAFVQVTRRQGRRAVRCRPAGDVGDDGVSKGVRRYKAEFPFTL